MLRIPARVGPSAIHGLGLFAVAPVLRGTVVWRLDPGIDLVLDEDLVAALPVEARLQIDRYAYRDPRRAARILCADDARYFNHADAANCGDAPDDGPDVTVALRDIEPGEELTWDYRESGATPPA